MHRAKWILLKTLGVLSLAVMVNGCSPAITAPGAPNLPVETVSRKPAPDGWNKILQAIRKNQSISYFGISADVATRENGKSHSSTIYGHVKLPDQADISQNIDGRSYYLFQDDKSSYYREENAWNPINRMAMPNTWAALARLAAQKPQSVYQLPDAIIISFPAEVYQFQADAVNLLELPAQTGQIPSLYTFYIDKKTGYLKKIEMESTSNIPEVGSITSTATFNYFDFNSKNKLDMPAGLKSQLQLRNNLSK